MKKEKREKRKRKRAKEAARTKSVKGAKTETKRARASDRELGCGDNGPIGMRHSRRDITFERESRIPGGRKRGTSLFYHLLHFTPFPVFLHRSSFITPPHLIPRTTDTGQDYTHLHKDNKAN